MKEVISRFDRGSTFGIVIGMIFGSTLIFGILSVTYGLVMGYELGDLSALMGDMKTALGRNKTRLFLLANHLFSFIIPGILIAYIVAGKKSKEYLAIHIPPKYINIGLGAILILAAYPFIQKSYEWNSLLPLPDWALELETTTNESLRDLLTMNSLGEFLLSIFVIAVIPGIGEEVIFRGIIQKEFYRWFNKKWIAVWLAAILFSAMHMQFQGFLPRLLLGAGLGYLYLLTKNLWIPIIIHFLNNAAPIIAMYVFGTDLADLSPEESPDIHILIALGSLLLAIGVGMYIYSRNKLLETVDHDHIEIT